ncbi:tetratricopeptide repeat protein [Bernardetia sp.]|uniref:tetratricopeptide repeat protein n=1 Tax=Bernardetia sp. TaxID=1937974 RepID=UPI0025B9DB0F|nr:tetratricopeptide repeat protein [Bernardetia sp.]
MKQIVWHQTVSDTSHLRTHVELEALLLEQQLDSALVYMQNSLKKAQQLKSLKWEGEFKLLMGRYYWYKTENQEGTKVFEEVLALAKKIDDKDLLARAQHQSGVFYSEMGDNQKALNNLFGALKYYEENKISNSLPSIYTDIGVLYYEQQLLEKAKLYHQKVLDISKKENKLAFKMRAYNNLGIIYLAEKNYQEALNNYKAALKINETIRHKQGDVIIFGNVAESFNYLEQYDSAIFYAQKSIEIAKETDFKRGLVRSKTILGDAYLKTNALSKALRELEEGLYVAKETQQSREGLNVLEILYQAYEKDGNPQKAYQTYKEYIVLRDSLSKLDDVKQLLQKEAIYKEEQLKAEEERKELQRRTERAEEARVRNMYLGGLFMVSVVLLLLGIGYRQKKKSNTRLEEQNQAIKLQQIRIETQNEELNVTNEELQTQQEKLEQTYNRLRTTTEKLDASIRYASDMQEAVLPKLDTLTSFFNNLFLIYRPKDIVSGDFYWFSQINQQVGILALADCTGHGVPGAFMSMLGATLLHETINIKKIQDDPARILNNLNSGIRKILKQETGQNDDGMDISIAIFEKMPTQNKIKVIFAGAKSTMYFVENNELTEIKGNNKHIGGRNKTSVTFQNTIFEVNSDTLFYLFTDGLSDQHNVNRKKFGSSQLKTFLLENHQRPIQEQKHYLVEKLKSHQGKEPQRDDISFIGFKIGQE